ncbi:MAG: hypothetical protein RIR62_958 [Pseudomonadota bacterium]
MASHIGRILVIIRLWAVVLFGAMLSAAGVQAAPYAAIVMDARSGEIIYSENAETRLHPASLTKMMTLYIAFEEIQRGNLSLDTMVTVSKNAAAQPPSRLGLRAGQKIQLRYLIRAAAIKSANDAAQAIGDFIGGDQAGFAKRMTRTAKALGMHNTTFKNASGLTVKGHLSTAYDMTILGRRLFYDFPQFYNLFSRRSTDAGIATVNNTNRRFLDAYDGADGIKTGYTVAAGFNLTASAERDGKRLIATVFGGKSTADRNARISKLLDMGFGKVPRNTPVNPPPAPDYQAADQMLMADATGPKTIRAEVAPTRSLRPLARPGSAPLAVAALAPVPEEKKAATAAAVDDMAALIAGAVAEAAGEPLPATAGAETQVAETVEDLGGAAPAALAAAGPEDMTLVEDVAAMAPPPQGTLQAQAAALDGTLTVAGLGSSQRPPKRNAPIFDDVSDVVETAAAAPEVVVSVSTSGERHFGINVGRFPSSYDAERALLQTQLAESATLNASLRKVIRQGGGFDATFVGLTQEQADLACRRLQARAMQCFTMGPG